MNVKLYILDKIFNRGSFCKNHVSETDLKKNIVPFKCSPKDFKKSLKELRNKGYLNTIRKSELEYCIVPMKIKTIKQMIIRNMEKESKLDRM